VTECFVGRDHEFDVVEECILAAIGGRLCIWRLRKQASDRREVICINKDNKAVS